MPFRLGMLGMWHTHATGIVRQVAAHPEEFQLVGFYDPDPLVVAGRRERWPELIPGFRLFDSPEALLAEELDGVVVEGQVYQNLRLARLALESGRPVMLEKPAGSNRAAHHALLDSAAARGLHVQMIYLFRYMSAVEEMLRLARSGVLGEIYHFRARLPKDLRDYPRFLEAFAWHPGGIFFEMAGHIIDLMVAVLGAPRRVTPFLAHHHSEAGTFADNGVTLFGYDHAFGILEVPALEVASHQRRIEVFGTSGACVIPHLGSGHLGNKNIQPIEVFRKGGGGWETLELPAATLQIRDLREFAAVCRGEKAPDFSLEHDRIVQDSLLDACGEGPDEWEASNA
jgi:predicted dehydrogenase